MEVVKLGEKERTFAFTINSAVVSTIRAPESKIVVDIPIARGKIQELIPNPIPRAVLLSIKNNEHKLHLAMYFKGSQDKEGYRQLVPFFHDDETVKLFDAEIFLSYPGHSREIVRESRTAASIVSHIADFDFENVEYGFGSHPTTINLHSHNGIKMPDGEPVFGLMIVLKKSAEAPSLEKRT